MFGLLRKLWGAMDRGEIERVPIIRPAGMARRHFMAALGVTSTTVTMGGMAGAAWKPERVIPELLPFLGPDGQPLLVDPTSGKAMPFDPEIAAAGLVGPDGQPKKMVRSGRFMGLTRTRFMAVQHPRVEGASAWFVDQFNRPILAPAELDKLVEHVRPLLVGERQRNHLAGDMLRVLDGAGMDCFSALETYGQDPAVFPAERAKTFALTDLTRV